MPKISALNEITSPQPDDILAGVDDSAETTKYIKISTLVNLMYPVGSIYMNKTDDTSPATLFGVGTWVRIQGRTIVGISDSDGDFGEGDTGGEKTHQLSLAELPAFSFGFSHHGDEGGSLLRSVFASGGSVGGYGVGQYRQSSGAIGGPASHVAPSWSFGGNGAHNNLQPYATAYMWERTA